MMNYEASETTSTALRHEVVNGFDYGFAEPLTQEQMARLGTLCLSLERGNKRALGGRAGGREGHVPGLGRVFVKHYARGGTLRLIVADRYLRSGPSRPEREFLMLSLCRSFGMNVPRPLACVVRGGIFYRGWLIMEEIGGARTLVEVALADEAKLFPLFDLLREQLRLLLINRIMHVDLHPGNVLVGAEGDLTLIDFDKAVRVDLSFEDLKDFYLRRWRRAVIKHRLPHILSELFSLKILDIEEPK